MSRGRSIAPTRVAVVGGGWAGCAAAVCLARGGAHVTLYEQSGVLGGRARTVTVDGVAVDNGQHLLIGGYRKTLDLLAELHGAEGARRVVARMPLTLVPYGTLMERLPTLVASGLPAPWHLAHALARARGLSLPERWAAVREFSALKSRAFLCPEGETVEQCFAQSSPAIYAALWQPLCLAALNTPPARASARAFGYVLRAALAGNAAASEFLIPIAHLGALLPEPAAAWLRAHGGEFRVGERVRSIVETDSKVLIATSEGTAEHDACVVAVGPHQLHHLRFEEVTNAWRRVQASVEQFAYESIHTVYLAYAHASMPARLARLDDAPGQWVFDRGSVDLGGASAHLLAVVISASGPHDAWPHPDLVARCDAQLRRLESSLSPLVWGRVVAERRATYACTPALERPLAGGVTPRTYLAGDYTHDIYPATLEAAVETGMLAARALLLSRPAA